MTPVVEKKTDWQLWRVELYLFTKETQCVEQNQSFTTHMNITEHCLGGVLLSCSAFHPGSSSASSVCQCQEELIPAETLQIASRPNKNLWDGNGFCLGSSNSRYMMPSTDFVVLSYPQKEFGNILGDLVAAFQHLRASYKKYGDRLYRGTGWDGTRGNGLKLKEGRFKLHILWWGCWDNGPDCRETW